MAADSRLLQAASGRAVLNNGSSALICLLHAMTGGLQSVISSYRSPSKCEIAKPVNRHGNGIKLEQEGVPWMCAVILTLLFHVAYRNFICSTVWYCAVNIFLLY